MRQIVNVKSGALRDILAHVIVSGLCSSGIYFYSKNVLYGILFMVGGIFIDLDHLIDHFLYFKKGFSLNDFLGAEYLRSGKVYLFVHSWEIAISMILLGVIIQSWGLLYLTAGMILHLLIDSIQRSNPFFYFLFYRWIYRFNIRRLLPEYELWLKARGCIPL